MLPDLELSLKINCSNHPCQEHIFMVQKVFKSLKFCCTCISHPFFESLRTGLTFILIAVRQQKLPISMFPSGTSHLLSDGSCGRGVWVRWEGGGKGRVRFHLSHNFFSDPSQSHQIFFRHPPLPTPARYVTKKLMTPSEAETFFL